LRKENGIKNANSRRDPGLNLGASKRKAGRGAGQVGLGQHWKVERVERYPSKHGHKEKKWITLKPYQFGPDLLKRFDSVDGKGARQ